MYKVIVLDCLPYLASVLCKCSCSYSETCYILLNNDPTSLEKNNFIVCILVFCISSYWIFRLFICGDSWIKIKHLCSSRLGHSLLYLQPKNTISRGKTKCYLNDHRQLSRNAMTINCPFHSIQACNSKFASFFLFF